MNELSQLAQLTTKEKQALKSMAKLAQQGLKSHVDMCKVWVKEFGEERREELKSLAQPYLRKRMIVMEGVGSGLVHPSLLFATHKSAEILRSLTLEEQQTFLNEGIPTLRNREGKISQSMLHHEEMNPDDVKVAWRFNGEKWEHVKRPEQKKTLLALTMDNQPQKTAHEERGWGSVKGDTFYPAPMRAQTGYGLKDLKKAIKLLEGK